jgi:hypothetical protein
MAAALLTIGSPARAQLIGLLAPSYNPDDPYQLPDAPAPPTLPDLTHRAWSLALDTTLARVVPNKLADGTQQAAVGVWLERLEVETAISNRRWYVGLAHEAAGGRNTGDKSATVVMSNPEIWGRALWASRAGLAYGGGLGIVPPLVRHDPDSGGAAIQSTVRIVRPWDFPIFADRTLTFRPFVDVRSIDGAVMLQLRQGIDISAQTSDVASLTPKTNLASRTMFYIGYRPLDQLGFGLELTEVYFIKATGVADDERAAFTVSPSVRWMSKVVQPAVSMLFPIDRPLFHAARSYWAAQLTLAVILDPSPPRSIW